jgi:predicted nucleotidyltransferase
VSKTALSLTDDELKMYQPDKRVRATATDERWSEAWQVARAAAALLRREFGASRVVVYGSLADRARFTRWSDIDLAAWGIPPALFYRAVAAVIGLSAQFKVDLVSPDDVRPSIRHAIELESVDL